MGDSRFSRYCKSNPRKMVKMWAEKEMRNLARLHAAGIRCPKPLQLRMHVLGEWVGGWGVAGGGRAGEGVLHLLSLTSAVASCCQNYPTAASTPEPPCLAVPCLPSQTKSPTAHQMNPGPDSNTYLPTCVLMQ